MSYQVLARKWRPQTFAEIVGQEHVTTTLANAFAKGRVAHAYLFTGPRGCGKTTMARLVAKALNCDQGPTASPCGTCDSCAGIADGHLMDVLEIDAASNTGVDNIRELRENAHYQATAGKKRVFIIDEVHMLSKGAFNALLKTLEEPPDHVHFIFATTEPVRIPRTILSRCQRFDFRLFRLEELVSRLSTIVDEEKLEVAPDAVELLASLAEGSMRDALSLLDQAVSSTDGTIDKDAVLALYGLVGPELYLQLNDAMLARDPRAALDLVEELSSSGHDLVEFARGLVANFRDLLLLRLSPDLASRVEKPEAIRTELLRQSAGFEVPDLVHLAERAAENYHALERAPQPRWLLETQVVEYVQHESQVLLSDLLGRLDAMGAGGGGAAPGRAGGSTPRPQSPPKAKPGRSAAAKVAAPTPPPPPAPETPPEPPTPTAEPGDGPSDPPAVDASLRDAYAVLVAKAREQNMGVGTCLLEAAPRLDGHTLHLVFRAEHAFHRDQVAQAEILRWLTALASECLGRKVTIEATSDEVAATEEALRRDVQEEVAPTQQQELQRRTQDNPELGRLLDGLGGQIVDGG